MYLAHIYSPMSREFLINPVPIVHFFSMLSPGQVIVLELILASLALLALLTPDYICTSEHSPSGRVLHAIIQTFTTWMSNYSTTG